MNGGTTALRHLGWTASTLVLLLSAGCGEGTSGDGSEDGDAGSRCGHCPGDQSVLDGGGCVCDLPTVHMRLEDGDFYGRPWPLATRASADGTLDLDDFPHPEAASWLTNNMETVATRSGGFGTTAAIFVSFDSAIDVQSLPADAAASLEPAASVFLVDIDRESPDFGMRTPIQCRYTAEASEYNPAFFLACLPEPGFPLRPATTYGLYITDALTAADGTPAAAADNFAALHGDAAESAESDSADPKLMAAYAPLFEHAAQLDIDAGQIVGGTVFTTQDPISPMRAIAAQARSMPPPTLVGTLSPSDVTARDPAETGNHIVLEGEYRAPIYQQGTTPYSNAGGDILFEDDGTPIIAMMENLRIVISLPTGNMPASGWPVTMYHHGTGDDAAGFVRIGTAYHAAAAGVAMVGIDAPVHGRRNPGGGDPTLLFFNIGNAPAMRDNVRQGAADLLWLQQLLLSLDISAADSPTNTAISFDPERIFFMGHSQGGLTGPLMLAVAEGIRGAMLSGAGGSIATSIVYKRMPIDIPAVARSLLALPEGQELTLFHPALALVQTFTEQADTTNFAPYLYRWAGGQGMHVWATQGLRDEIVPPVITDALVTSMGLQPAGQLLHRVEGLELRGIESIDLPARDNIEAIDGNRYTGVYTQYPAGTHSLITRDDTARAQLTQWLRTLATEDSPELPAP